jgi:predicted AlkP superfamily phosphohydrolase/phosphomutase
MKKSGFQIYAILIILMGIATPSCQNRMNKEEKSRQKAMNEIQQAKEAIDDYLTLIEKRHVDLFDLKIVEMNNAMNKLRKERKSYTDSKDVEEKIIVLKGHKQLLLNRIDELKQSSSNNCNDFSVKIDHLFDDLDEHLNLVDSLLIGIE